MWSRTKPELFFTTLDEPTQQIMLASYTVEGETFRPGKPRVWTETRIANRRSNLNIALHPDGTRFAAVAVRDNVASPKQDKLVLVFNFFDELKRLLAQ